MNKSKLRRSWGLVALAAVLGLAAVGLSQCRMVDDTVTGVDLRSSTGLSLRRAWYIRVFTVPIGQSMILAISS